MAKPDPSIDPTADTACGFVAIIGAPNAGKSTLVNQLTGAKVAIVSHKVQTTRSVLRGIAIHGKTQLIFVDTPGLFAPKRRLDKAMVQSAWSGAADADVVALLIDARKGIDAETDAILARLDTVKAPKLLVLNKIDLVKRDSLLALAEKANAGATFQDTFMVSALTGDGVADLRADLAARMPPGPWLYPEDQIADAPTRFLAAEITREKIFHRLHQELPYASTVETEAWTENPDGSVRIDQTIYVERDSQKPIVIGKQGRTIRDISTEAREEIAALLGRKVHLFLFVKVRGRWAEDPERYRAMGLEFPNE